MQPWTLSSKEHDVIARSFAENWTKMSEEQNLGEDSMMMKMEDEDGEGLGEEQMPVADEEGGQGEAEGSKIDASKNEEDEGWVNAVERDRSK